MSSFRHAQVANKGCGVEKHRGAFCGGGGGSCPPFSFDPGGGTQKRHHHPTAKANGSDGADSVQPASRLRRVRSTKKSRRSRALANFGRAAGRVRHCHSGTEAARQGKAAYPTNVVTGKRFRGSALVESGWTATNSRSRLTISRTVKTFRTPTPARSNKHPLKPLNPGGFGLNVSGRVKKCLETANGFMKKKPVETWKKRK